MANTALDVGATYVAAGGGSAGGDVVHQFITLTSTDATATWTVTGIKLNYIMSVDFGTGSDTAPTEDDKGNYYIDQDPDASGGWVVTSGTIAVARVKQVAGGTLAADSVSMTLHGF